MGIVGSILGRIQNILNDFQIILFIFYDEDFYQNAICRMFLKIVTIQLAIIKIETQRVITNTFVTNM
jgi:hypothetical protein